MGWYGQADTVTENFWQLYMHEKLELKWFKWHRTGKRKANTETTHIQVQNWKKSCKLGLLSHVYTFCALASQLIKWPPAICCPDVNCLLQVQLPCIHISCSNPSTNLNIFGLALLFGSNGMQSMIMWYQIQNALVGWRNGWIVCKVWKCWFHRSKVDFMLVARPKKKKQKEEKNKGGGGNQNPRTARSHKLPARPKTRRPYQMIVTSSLSTLT